MVAGLHHSRDMAASSTPEQRSRRSFRLLAALAVLALAITLWRATHRDGSPAEARGRTQITQQLVVERVQAVAKLVSSETTVRDVVVYENTRLGSTKRALVVVTGKVLAGFDLDTGMRAHIDHDARRITITLPHAEVLAVEVVDLKTYDERAGLWNPFRPADRDLIYQRVRSQLERASEEMNVVEHAERSAKTLLQTLFAVDGYIVDIAFRAPLVVKTPGG
jgi:hypothetical protein